MAIPACRVPAEFRWDGVSSFVGLQPGIAPCDSSKVVAFHADVHFGHPITVLLMGRHPTLHVVRQLDPKLVINIRPQFRQRVALTR